MSVTFARGHGVTLWRQIAESLNGDVRTGRLKAGAQLPTELELAQRFAVNRHTVRRAVAVLADQGVLRIEQGRGTFVNETTIDYVLGRRTRFSANLHAQGRGPGHRVLAAEAIAASDSVAGELRLRAGAPVMRIETLGS